MRRLDRQISDSRGSGPAGTGILQKAAIAAWLILIVAVFLNRDRVTVDSILSYTPENILPAILMILALFALKTLSVVFYSGIIFTVSGIIFDLPLAIAVNCLGALVMLLEGYAIGRAGGQRLVAELSAKYPRFASFTGLKDDHPFAFALLIRMLKVINYDLGSMYMGASGIRLIPYLGGSLLGLLPEAVLFALAGSGIGDMNAVPVLTSAAIYAVMTIVSVTALHFMLKNSGSENS